MRNDLIVNIEILIFIGDCHTAKVEIAYYAKLPISISEWKTFLANQTKHNVAYNYIVFCLLAIRNISFTKK